MSSNVAIRKAEPADAAACGAICYQAFAAISAAHGFAPDFPSAEVASNMLAHLFAQEGYYALIAERAGRIVGSNVMDERAVIRGIGPITVEPGAQNAGVGRALMRAMMDRARESGAPGTRLVQAAFHNRSLSLYTSLGFDVREPLACIQGRSRTRSIPGCEVRAARMADLGDCDELSQRVHGFDRSRELAAAIQSGTARVVERAGRLTGYSTDLAFSGHSVGETHPDLQALIASAEGFGGPGILVPSRNHALFRWCIASGLRVVQPMTLMSVGLYSEPDGAWLPSILF